LEGQAPALAGLYEQGMGGHHLPEMFYGWSKFRGMYPTQSNLATLLKQPDVAISLDVVSRHYDRSSFAPNQAYLELGMRLPKQLDPGSLLKNSPLSPWKITSRTAVP
jgi:hypothetical protein